MLPRLFEPFVQSDRSLERTRGGLGLGLAVAQGLVQLHGGHIEAISEGIGRGAEFIIRLPLHAEPPALTRHAGGTNTEEESLRILVVEDNRDAADSLRMLLELLGHQVRWPIPGRTACRRPTVASRCRLVRHRLAGLERLRESPATCGENPATAHAQLNRRHRLRPGRRPPPGRRPASTIT